MTEETRERARLGDWELDFEILVGGYDAPGARRVPTRGLLALDLRDARAEAAGLRRRCSRLERALERGGERL